MRILTILIVLTAAMFSCVKPPNQDPIPEIEYRGVPVLGKATSASEPPRDTAVLVIRYSDGDGDIFRNSNSDGPNLIYATYALNADSGKFVREGDMNQTTITQPANGYYKGKAIYGDIYLPMRQFRSSDKVKVIKFEAFMVDMQDHKSNVITSPVFTLNF
jgi:hypothetical protein